MKLGQCFSTSYEALTPEHDHLVHGVVIGTGGKVLDKSYVHAWIEYTNCGLLVCFDTESGLHVPKSMYYHVGNVQNTVKYTFSEAQKLACENQNAGPWDEYNSRLMEEELSGRLVNKL